MFFTPPLTHSCTGWQNLKRWRTNRRLTVVIIALFLDLLRPWKLWLLRNVVNFLPVNTVVYETAMLWENQILQANTVAIFSWTDWYAIELQCGQHILIKSSEPRNETLATYMCTDYTMWTHNMCVYMCKKAVEVRDDCARWRELSVYQ
jgi:hypothetical protein